MQKQNDTGISTSSQDSFDYTRGLDDLANPAVWEESPEEPPTFEWLEPQPIDKPLPPVSKMPEGILPDALEGWLADIAQRKEVPLEFPTVTAIAMISSIVGNRIGIQPKEKDSWLVIPNLWGCIVGSPSMLKTPTIKDVIKPIEGLEREATNDYKAATLDYKASAERKKLELDLIKKKGKGGSKDLDEVEKEMKVVMQDDDQPTRKRYLSNDATIEKLGMILNENPHGIFVYRDELSGLLSSWNKAGREQDRAFYLEAWNGYGSFSVDRVGRPDLFIENLCLSLFGGIQPSKLAGYFHDISGYGNDGMFQRFQLSVYPDPIKRGYVDKYPSAEARERAYKVIQKLVELDYVTAGIKDKFTPVPYLKFTVDAQTEFRRWMEGLETLLSSEELSPLLEEHFAKYRSLVPSLALIFHLIDCVGSDTPSKYVTLSALQKAISFSEFLKEHAIRIYSLFGDTKHQASYALSKRIAKSDLGESFKVADVVRKGWQFLSDTNQVKDAVEELIAANWLVEEPRENQPSPRGGRPEAPNYWVNPYTFKFYTKG